jgi:ferric-dicitrate binding protein FerR (iron transport regulator)
MTSFLVEQIISSFEGKLTEDEKAHLQNWLDESPDHQLQFDELKRVYNATNHIRIEFQPDEQQALRAVNRKLQNRRIVVWSQRIAVSFALFFVLTRVISYFLSGNDYLEISSVSQQVIYLPDSSKVTLAAHSFLKYQKQFEGKERDVVLRGKAYFEVRPNKHKFFIISTSNTKIRVLGTKFLVDAKDASKEIVIVDEGKVAFSSIKDAKRRSLELVANKVGIWSAVDNSLVEQPKSTPNQNASISRRLIFNDTPLREVIQDFETYFKIKVVLEDKKLENLKYSGIFSDIRAEKAVDILAKSLNLTVSKIDSIYFIQP